MVKIHDDGSNGDDLCVEMMKRGEDSLPLWDELLFPGSAAKSHQNHSNPLRKTFSSNENKTATAEARPRRECAAMRCRANVKQTQRQAIFHRPVVGLQTVALIAGMRNVLEMLRHRSSSRDFGSHHPRDFEYHRLFAQRPSKHPDPNEE